MTPARRRSTYTGRRATPWSRCRAGSSRRASGDAPRRLLEPGGPSSACVQRSSSVGGDRSIEHLGVERVAQRLAARRRRRLSMKRSTMRGSSAGTSAMSCGVTITFSSSHSGLSWGSGSSAKTSSAAPLSVPSCSRSASAASSITVPRPTLTSTAPGLTRPSVSASSSPRVASVAGERADDRVGAADERAQLARPGGARRRAATPPSRLRLTAEHVHAERARQPRGLGADGADADEQQRLAAQLADRVLPGRPVALALPSRGAAAGPWRTRAGRGSRTRPAARRGRRRRW